MYISAIRGETEVEPAVGPIRPDGARLMFLLFCNFLYMDIAFTSAPYIGYLHFLELTLA